jgi:hypothetical protein
VGVTILDKNKIEKIIVRDSGIQKIVLEGGRKSVKTAVVLFALTYSWQNLKAS